MSILKGVLDEENKRLKRLLGKYQRDIDALIKGSVSIKDISGQRYAYIAKRKGDTVVFEYIGKASSDKVKRLLEEVNKRKKLTVKIKALKQDIKEIERALGGRKI
ncbi:MAG TPA: hypothetical protein PKJ16_04165 [Spirochaetota bacterium]|nr:hypothetical protein [Spirochaetota bacterium]